jgi:hypothetical protein
MGFNGGFMGFTLWQTYKKPMGNHQTMGKSTINHNFQ